MDDSQTQIRCSQAVQFVRFPDFNFSVERDDALLVSRPIPVENHGSCVPGVCRLVHFISTLETPDIRLAGR